MEPVSDNTADASREPRRVLTIDYARRETLESRWSRWLSLTAAIAWGNCLLGTVGIFVDAETALLSGPLLLSAGVLMILAGVKSARRLAMMVGCGHVGVCLLFFGLVNVLHWGPGAAQRPFMVMASLYTALTVVPSIMVYLRR